MKKPITALRQALRRGIVQEAQHLVTAPSYDKVAANLAKSTFAEPSDLSKFFLPSCLIYKDKMFDPYDRDEFSLSAPTLDLTLSRDVRRKLGNSVWKTQKAREMLDRLFKPRACGGNVTAFLRAADQYHVERISKSMSAETVIADLNEKFPPRAPSFLKTLSYRSEDNEKMILCHLDVLLSKLLIHRDYFICLPQISSHRLKLAKDVYFKKLALQTCTSCPSSALLTIPRN